MMAAMNIPQLRGELLIAEPMAAHTSWRAGGPADHCYRPADLEDLAVFIRSLSADEPLYWIGLGSNLLVRDGGLRGTVIMPFGGLGQLKLLVQNAVEVGAGAPCARVARFAARNGLVGAEFLAGIPGTMGGALAMNAGAFGSETWPLVQQVQTLDRNGEIHQRTAAEYEVAYRSVSGPSDEWFISATLQLQSGDTATAKAEIKKLLEHRSATQPTGVASCGSVFRNPANDFAARLIESCGLKGVCMGNAEVSTRHANFIINRGNASAADIEQLIYKVQAEVERQHGVLLVPEVRIIGESM